MRFTLEGRAMQSTSQIFGSTGSSVNIGSMKSRLHKGMCRASSVLNDIVVGPAR